MTSVEPKAHVAAQAEREGSRESQSPSFPELRELLEKATKGPWHIDPKRAEAFYEDVNVLTHYGLAVAVAVHNGDIQPPTVEANARLIVAAVNALPHLLEELGKLDRVVQARDRQLTEEIALTQKFATRFDAATARALSAEQEVERLKKALAPFAAIQPSSLYAADGSDKEQYVVMLKGSWDNPTDLTGEDLALARSALKGTGE